MAQEFIPADPNYEQRSRENFESQEFMRHLGAKMTLIRPGFCEFELAFQPAWSQQHGFFHGGVVASLADVAGGYAAFSLLDTEATNVTVEFKVNFTASAAGEKLLARAAVLKRGKSLTISRTDVFEVGEGNEKLCATALATYMAVVGR